MAPPLKAACKYGHPFTCENTISEKMSNGYTVRKCRACRQAYDRERYRDKPYRQEALKIGAAAAYARSKVAA